MDLGKSVMHRFPVGLNDYWGVLDRQDPVYDWADSGQGDLFTAMKDSASLCNCNKDTILRQRSRVARLRLVHIYTRFLYENGRYNEENQQNQVISDQFYCVSQMLVLLISRKST